MSAGAARLLFGDAIVTVLVANEFRHRAVERVFGVTREQSNSVSVIAMGSLATGVQLNASKMLAAAATPPTLAAMVFGTAMVKEALLGVAGTGSRNVPGFATLLAVGVVGTSAVPLLRAAGSAAGGARDAERRLRAAVRAMTTPGAGTAPHTS